MMVMVFLKTMQNRDDDLSHFILRGTCASDIAAGVGELLGTNKTAVYNAYKEWKEGERLDPDNDGPPRPGAFNHRTKGTYERQFLLNHEDLKMKFKKWMRKNFHKLSVVLVWEYLNTKLLKEVDEATLRSHNISLPICKDTAHRWMLKCQAK